MAIISKEGLLKYWLLTTPDRKPELQTRNCPKPISGLLFMRP